MTRFTYYGASFSGYWFWRVAAQTEPLGRSGAIT